MFRLPIARYSLLALGLVGLMLSGCDPKRIAGEEGGTNTGGTSNGPTTIGTEARQIGAIVTLHTTLIPSMLAQSAIYDDQLSGSARAWLTSGCVDVSVVDDDERWYELYMTDCVDGNGTDLRGGGTLEPFSGVDGYYFFPYGPVETRIAADNENDSIYNHQYNQGNLHLTFVRNGSDVTAIEITSFLRHQISEDAATFGYDSVRYTGGHGNWSAWPASGATINGAWDGVGAFEIVFSGGPAADYTVKGIDYTVNLSTGEVSFNDN